MATSHCPKDPNADRRSATSSSADRNGKIRDKGQSKRSSDCESYHSIDKRQQMLPRISSQHRQDHRFHRLQVLHRLFPRAHGFEITVACFAALTTIKPITLRVRYVDAESFPFRSGESWRRKMPSLVSPLEENRKNAQSRIIIGCHLTGSMADQRHFHAHSRLIGPYPIEKLANMKTTRSIGSRFLKLPRPRRLQTRFQQLRGRHTRRHPRRHPISGSSKSQCDFPVRDSAIR